MAKPAREIWATVTERGQVTIPSEVRKALGLHKHGKVLFRVEDGVVVLKKPRFSSVAEIVASAPKLEKPMSWQKIQEALDQDRAEAYREKQNRETTR